MKNISNKSAIPRKMTHYGIYAFALCIPISFVPAEIAVVVACIGWILDGIINHHWSWYPEKYFIPILFYVLWNILASALSPRPVHSLCALVDNEWPLLIMILMVSTIQEINVLKRIVHLWLFTATIAALYGIWQTFTGIQLHRSGVMTPMGNYFRATGFSGFYLTFAGFMMSVFFISLCLGFHKSISRRWEYIISAFISFAAVLGTFARSIWLSFLVAIPMYGFNKGKRIGTLVTGSFIFIILICLVLIPTIRERASSIVFPSENQTRINLWKTSFHIFQEYPLTGIGEDNFDYYFEMYRVDGYYDATGHPHSDYLNVLVNSGIPGFIAYVSIWIVIIIHGISTVRKSKDPYLKEFALGGTLAILGFMVGGFFQNYYGTFANCWGWWFITGIVLTSYRLSKKDYTSV